MSVDIRLVRWAHRDRDDFQRLTTALSRLRDAVRRGGDMMSPEVPQGPEEPTDRDRANALLRQQTARAMAAGDYADLFADPAWHILLTLFVADGALTSETIKAGCGALPMAAARWLAMLEQRELIALTGDNGGNTVALTASGHAFLTRCLRAI